MARTCFNNLNVFYIKNFRKYTANFLKLFVNLFHHHLTSTYIRLMGVISVARNPNLRLIGFGDPQRK